MRYDIETAKTLTNIEDEALLDFYIQAVVGRIEKIIHYKLARGSKTELVNGLDTNYIFVKEKCIESISNAYRGCERLGCVLIGRKIIFDEVINKNEFIRVEYEGGYEEMPAELLFFICSTIKESLSNAEGLKSYGIRGINYSFLDKIEQSDNFVRGVRDLFGGVEI